MQASASRVDSVDLAQNAFTNFLIAARTGEFSQLDPKNTIALLVRTSHEKVAQTFRFDIAGKRNIRRDEAAGDLHSDHRRTALGPTERTKQAAISAAACDAALLIGVILQGHLIDTAKPAAFPHIPAWIVSWLVIRGRTR